MSTLYLLLRLWMSFVVFICCTHGQSLSSSSLKSRTQSSLGSQNTTAPGDLRFNLTSSHNGTRSVKTRATHSVPHAMFTQPPPSRSHNSSILPSNSSIVLHNNTRMDIHPGAGNPIVNKLTQVKLNQTDLLLGFPAATKNAASRNESSHNAVQSASLGKSGSSSANHTGGVKPSAHDSNSLTSKSIRATNIITFGLPPKSVGDWPGTHTANESIITPPPAPPIRPGGLNLTGVKAVKVSNSAWSTNTSLTTILPGQTSPTIVPVLVKAAGVGLAVFGLSAALEAGAPLMDAGEALEVAEDEAAGEEEQENDDESESLSSSLTTMSSSSSVTASTSSTYSSSSGSSTSSGSSSSSSTSSSSQSSSSQSSTTTDACSNPTDFPHLGGADDYNSDDEYENSRVRRLNRRSSRLASRQLMGANVNMKKTVTKLGSCTLDQDTSVPPFWKANSLMGKKGNSAYWYMAVPEDPGNLNAAPTYTRAATAALRTLSPSRKNVVIGGSRGYRTNVDHVYEVSLLKNFFNYYLAQKSVCQDFNFEFMRNSTTGNQASTWLSTIFAQLPGVQHGGLAGMDQRLNSIKAYFFQAGEIQNGLGFRANGLCDSIKNLQMAGMVMDMLHSAELRTFFDDANSRIYQALLQHDHTFAVDVYGKCNQPPKSQFSWAEEYKGWIDWFLSEREFEIQNWARNTQKSILSNLNQRVIKTNQNPNGDATIPDPSFDDDRERMKGYMKSAYSQNSHWSFGFNLQYPKNTLPVGKRDESCIKSIQSTPAVSTTSATETVSPTLTVAQQASATARQAAAVDGGEQVQPHKAPVPDGVVNFINGKNLPGPPAHSDSANQLNNEHSGNQFNNAIQRMSPPAATSHPSGSGNLAQSNPLAGSIPVNA